MLSTTVKLYIIRKAAVAQSLPIKRNNKSPLNYNRISLFSLSIKIMETILNSKSLKDTSLSRNPWKKKTLKQLFQILSPLSRTNVCDFMTNSTSFWCQSFVKLSHAATQISLLYIKSLIESKFCLCGIFVVFKGLTSAFHPIRTIFRYSDPQYYLKDNWFFFLMEGPSFKIIELLSKILGRI